MRAGDSVRICELLFGEEFVHDNTVMSSLINANSPLGRDFRACSAQQEAYARGT